MVIETNSDGRTGALILAAGKGTRMHSERPKVLQTILGEPMLAHVLRAIDPVCPQGLVVLGHKAEEVQTTLDLPDARIVTQKQQLGTGHAVQCAWPNIERQSWKRCVVVNGDAPLVQVQTIQDLLCKVENAGAALGFLSIEPQNPAGYGRVVRNAQGRVTAIVEAKDFSEREHGPDAGEVNAGIYVLDVARIGPLLDRLSNANAQNEYYLTDLIDMATAAGETIVALNAGQDPSLLGVNTPSELVACEELLRSRLVRQWLDQGVLVRSPEQVRIGALVQLTPGAEICGPCTLTGKTSVAEGAVVSEYCWLHDATVGAGARVYPFSHLERADVGDLCAVGPYARLRPGTCLHRGAKIGNFVETKKAVLGPDSKANHLSYLGDCELGSGVNIGAGTITCNYDGANKHRTDIGDGVFIGSNSALVAPVRIGDNALVGAGSTITKDVPAKTLAVARVRQKNLALKQKAKDHDHG